MWLSFKWKYNVDSEDPTLQSQTSCFERVISKTQNLSNNRNNRVLLSIITPKFKFMNIENCNTLILFSTPLTSSVCATRSRNSVSSSTDIFTCAVVAYLKTTDINYSITTKINSSVIDSFVNSRLRIILYENHSWKTSEGLEILISSSF